MEKSNFFDSIEERVIAVGIIIMVLMEAFNAISRNFIPAVGAIPEEIAVFAYIWVCFLCASFCIKKGNNIVVDVLSARYSKKIQYILKCGQHITDIIIYSMFLYGAFIFVGNTMSGGEKGVTGIPLWIIYIAPIAGFALCIIRSVQRLIKLIKEKETALESVKTR